LIAVLQNKKEYRDTRGYAAKGLGFLGQKAAKKTIPVLVAALASSHIPVYYESAVALGKIGGMAVPALRPVFFGNNSSHRAGAARALGFIGKPAIPMLLEGLKHKKWGIRWRSAMALGRMGTQARPAIPALRKAQKDKTLLVSKAATKAIKSISGK
jgi:HEAT repeat protein